MSYLLIFFIREQCEEILEFFYVEFSSSVIGGNWDPYICHDCALFWKNMELHGYVSHLPVLSESRKAYLSITNEPFFDCLERREYLRVVCPPLLRDQYMYDTSDHAHQYWLNCSCVIPGRLLIKAVTRMAIEMIVSLVEGDRGP